jgi:hypothetical protein
MNQDKIIKLAPTILMITLLGFSAYSVHGGGDETPAPKATDASTGSTLAQVETEILALESAIVSSASAVRDPFRTAAAAAEEIKAEMTQGGPDHSKRADSTDPIAQSLKEMSLDLTFVQGSEQVAVINGKMYRKGQRLTFPESTEQDAPVSLVMTFVRKDRVFFRGDNKTYSLGYPEKFKSVRHSSPGDNETPLEAEMGEIDPGGELEFYKSLSNSPLGKMGQGLTKSMGIKLPPSKAGGSQ